MHTPWTRRVSIWLSLFSLAMLTSLACDTMLGSVAKVNGSGSSTSNVLGALTAASCPALVSGGSSLGTKFSSNVQANIKVAAFVQAAKDLQGVAAKAEAELTQVCKRMGADLGLSPEKMKAMEGVGGSVKGACSAVSAQIASILQAGISIKVEAVPPKCEVNASVQSSCEASCHVEASPGEIVATCEPAKLSGVCQGTCQGQCDGTCNGKCNGSCTAKDAQGNCVGQCSGECNGQCNATCHASCQGTWQAPKCEGSVKGPQVDADCQASCKASANFKAECSKPSLNIQASQNTEMIGKLLATLKANLPALLAVQYKLGKQIAGDVKTLVTISGQLPKVLKGAGGQAIACVTASATAIAQASVSIKVSVQASASISGKVGAGM